MNFIEFKLKGGNSVYVNKDQIAWFTVSIDHSEHTEMSVGGQKIYLGQTTAQVKKLIEEA